MRARMASSGLKRYDGRCADGLGVGRDLAQWRDVVENPEAAAVGADHQVVLVVIGVDVEVADGGAGQVLAQRLPVIAIIEADIHRGLGSGEEQARLLRIDPQTVDPASGALVAGQAVDDAGPGLARVGGAPDERHVGVLVGGQSLAALGANASGDEGGIDVVACLDGIEVGVGRNVGDVGDVRPGFALIHGVVDLSVAADRPDDAAFDPG